MIPILHISLTGQSVVVSLAEYDGQLSRVVLPAPFCLRPSLRAALCRKDQFRERVEIVRVVVVGARPAYVTMSSDVGRHDRGTGG